MFGWQFQDMGKQVYADGSSSLLWNFPDGGELGGSCQYDSLAEAEKLVKSLCSSQRSSLPPHPERCGNENGVGHLAVVS